MAPATIGKRAFLGNSGITQPGRRVPDDGLVAVLSATPHKAEGRLVLAGQPADPVAPRADAADVLAHTTRRRGSRWCAAPSRPAGCSR